tara:strand:- start:71 stop:568 length:498 start_codon:yes stop_codon:yes gene_type:complete
MTFIPFRTTSSLKSDILVSKAGAEISGVVTAHFDRTQISNTDISSSNDYQFTLSSSSGSSFLLEGNILVDNTDTSTATAIMQWYDETNSSFIGSKCRIVNQINAASLDPAYPTTASALILSSDFGGSDITVSLRAVSTSGNATYPANVTASQGRDLRAIFKILQT